MKTSYLLISLFLCLISHIVADPTENYQVLTQAAQAAGVDLVENQRYAFYEYWAVNRLASFPKIPECILGYKHIRLVVGSVPRTTRTRTDKDFVAQAWDLAVTNPQDAGLLLQGGKTDAGPEPWQANKNSNGDPVGPNQYVYAGTVSKNNKCIQSASDQYIKDNPTYSIGPNGANCKNYAAWLYQQIK